MINIAFRVDGSSNIGMGHIMRCLSLAKEFRENNFKVYFISRHYQGIDKIKEENFEVIQISSNIEYNINGFNYGNKEDLKKEIEDLLEIINKYDIYLMIIDSYNVTRDYFLRLKSNTNKLVYIDDINKFIYPVDILINGNITGEYINYKKYSDDEIMLLGLKYNLIREEFKCIPGKKINKEVSDIMITTGGSDPYNITEKIIRIVLNDDMLKRLNINVVIGSGFKDKDELKKLEQCNDNIVLYENVKRMSNIMLKSDIAISAGGSTLYELCACGVPTISFILAYNQEFVVEKMEELGYIKSLGWYGDIDSKTLNNYIKRLIGDYDIRVKMHNKQRNLVDGKGTQRIVEKIANIL